MLLQGREGRRDSGALLHQGKERGAFLRSAAAGKGRENGEWGSSAAEKASLDKKI